MKTTLTTIANVAGVVIVLLVFKWLDPEYDWQDAMFIMLFVIMVNTFILLNKKH